MAKSSHLLHLRFKESEEYSPSWLKREMCTAMMSTMTWSEKISKGEVLDYTDSSVLNPEQAGLSGYGKAIER